MGDEIRCTARLGRQRSEGRALLETADVLFRGDFRARVPLKEITDVVARDGTLRLTWPGGTLALDLGARADRWAERIRSPRSVLDKLGVKSGHTVSVIGNVDAELLAQLRARAAAVVTGRVAKGSDLVFFAVERSAQLERLERIASLMARDGAIWVIRPKGVREITERDVMAGAKRAGLVDTKVVRVSETLTGERLVIPVAKR